MQNASVRSQAPGSWKRTYHAPTVSPVSTKPARFRTGQSRRCARWTTAPTSRAVYENRTSCAPASTPTNQGVANPPPIAIMPSGQSRSRSAWYAANAVTAASIANPGPASTSRYRFRAAYAARYQAATPPPTTAAPNRAWPRAANRRPDSTSSPPASAPAPTRNGSVTHWLAKAYRMNRPTPTTRMATPA